MPARFCPQCGTSAASEAKFCIECGSSLTGGAAVRAPPPGGWQMTSAGVAVLELLPRRRARHLGRRPEPVAADARTRDAARRVRPRPSGTQTAQADLPPDHPKVPIQIPAEVKTFIDDLAKKASAAPDDLATWGRLAQVYYRTAQVDPSYYDEGAGARSSTSSSATRTTPTRSAASAASASSATSPSRRS